MFELYRLDVSTDTRVNHGAPAVPHIHNPIRTGIRLYEQTLQVPTHLKEQRVRKAFTIIAANLDKESIALSLISLSTTKRCCLVGL